MNWRRIFRRNRRDAELTSEIEAHIAEETAENIERGMPADEARRQAYLKFGNPQLLRERIWQQNSFVLVDGLWRDLKYSARTLLRSKAFSFMAVIVMALGIGGTVAMFTVVRSVLLNPLPFPKSHQLYTLYERDTRKEFGPFLPVAAGSFREWKNAAEGKAQMALVSPWQEYNVSAEGGKLPEKVDAAWCSWNFFNVLGVRPVIGRTFSPSDDRADSPGTALLTYSFWMRRYSGDRSILGQNIYLDAKPHTVIGVLPESFAYESAMSGNTQQVWTPVTHEAPSDLMEAYNNHNFLVVARTAQGTSLQQLLSQLNTVQQHIHDTQGGSSVHSAVNGHSMLDDAVSEYKTPLYVLLAATGCVLLIACLNVASLLVARISARSKEHAIRAALGGSRWRLLRERLMESLVLAASGGALALLLAWAAVRWLVAMRADMNRVEDIHLDGFAVAFTIAMVVLAALFSAVVSSLSMDRKQVLAALQESSRSHSGSSARATLRRGLLVVEVTLTVVLLVAAGMLLRSYDRLRNTDLGVPADNLLTLTVSLPDARYGDGPKAAAFFEQLILRVRALPGVQAAGLTSRAPGQGWGGDSMMEVTEHPPLPKGVGLGLQRRGIDPGYFAAAQIPLIEGRTFRADERLDRDNVSILSASGAKLLFPNEDPIGKHIHREGDKKIYEVVGVVGDTRWRISERPMETWYMPIFGNRWTNATVVVRAPQHVESLALPVQKVIGELDPDLPVSEVMTLRQTISQTTLSSQFDSLLVLAFAVIALLLAAAGLYSVVAYLVTQRTSEIGIRIALGAKREQVLRLIVADGLRPALVGLIAGLAASAFATRFIQSMLYETKPFDLSVFLAVTLTLLGMAAVACLVPAWRASRLDPMQALRSE